MIYELHGKIPRNSSFLYSEDILTSTVFGNLRYFSSNSLINDFLSEAIDLKGNIFNYYFSDNIKINFCKKFSNKTKAQINEPDLVLEDKNSVLIIECKYHSPLDECFSENENEYTNQLLRYSTIIKDYYAEKKNKNIIFLTLKDYDVETCLEKTRKKLSPEIGLYWLHWEKLFLCLKKYEDKVTSISEKTLITDLIQFLENRNLKYFSGIRIPYFSFTWKYKSNKRYIFASKFNTFSWRWRYNYE